MNTNTDKKGGYISDTLDDGYASVDVNVRSNIVIIHEGKLNFVIPYFQEKFKI